MSRKYMTISFQLYFLAMATRLKKTLSFYCEVLLFDLKLLVLFFYHYDDKC